MIRFVEPKKLSTISIDKYFVELSPIVPNFGQTIYVKTKCLLVGRGVVVGRVRVGRKTFPMKTGGGGGGEERNM
jgi:hypothetical protein